MTYYMKTGEEDKDAYFKGCEGLDYGDLNDLSMPSPISWMSADDSGDDDEQPPDHHWPAPFQPRAPDYDIPTPLAQPAGQAPAEPISVEDQMLGSLDSTTFLSHSSPNRYCNILHTKFTV